MLRVINYMSAINSNVFLHFYVPFHSLSGFFHIVSISDISIILYKWLLFLCYAIFIVCYCSVVVHKCCLSPILSPIQWALVLPMAFGHLPHSAVATFLQQILCALRAGVVQCGCRRRSDGGVARVDRTDRPFAAGCRYAAELRASLPRST